MSARRELTVVLKYLAYFGTEVYRISGINGALAFTVDEYSNILTFLCPTVNFSPLWLTDI